MTPSSTSGAADQLDPARPRGGGAARARGLIAGGSSGGGVSLIGRRRVIDAADHALLRSPSFLDLFLDRSRWPELTQTGYERETEKLAKLAAVAKR